MLSFLREITKRVMRYQDRDIDRLQIDRDDSLSKPERVILGLDLGEVQDHSALCALQAEKRPDAKGKTVRHFACRLLCRWPLNTGYEEIIEDLRKICENLPSPPDLVVDGTGAGRPVLQMLVSARLAVDEIIGVIITGGTQVSHPGPEWHVAKRELVSTVSSVLQSKRLQISTKLSEYKTLLRELQNFKVKINVNTGNESFEAWRAREHDDLVLATALALWWGEYFTEFSADMVYV